MRQVIAEHLQPETGAVIGARTVDALTANCVLIGNEIAIGIVDVRIATGRVSIRVSADEKDFQRARVYDNGKLIESLLSREGSVVYVDEAANPQGDAPPAA